jgi:hypothetical protein
MLASLARYVLHARRVEDAHHVRDERVAAVVEQLAERGGRACAASLLAVDGVEGLVQEVAEEAHEVEPGGDRGVHLRASEKEGASERESWHFRLA